MMRKNVWYGGVLAALLTGVASAMPSPQEPPHAEPPHLSGEQAKVDLNRLADRLRSARHEARAAAANQQDPKDRMRKALRTLADPKASHEARAHAAHVVQQAQAEQADRVASLEARNRDLKARLAKIEKALHVEHAHRALVTHDLLAAKDLETAVHREYVDHLQALHAQNSAKRAASVYLKDLVTHAEEVNVNAAHKHLLEALAAHDNHTSLHAHAAAIVAAQALRGANNQAESTAEALQAHAEAARKLAQDNERHAANVHEMARATAEKLVAEEAAKHTEAAEVAAKARAVNRHEIEAELHAVLHRMKAELAELRARVEKLERSRRVARPAKERHVKESYSRRGR